MANAAQAVLRVAGATIGFIVGGPVGAAWGYQIGSVAGDVLFPTDLGTVSGPRLNDLNIMTSTIGAPIAIVYGSYPVAGNLIWSSGIIETVKKKKQGGKGGPTQTVKTYTYKVNCAVGICEGDGIPILGIIRVWADAKLIYDARPQFDTETDDAFAERSIANSAFLLNATFYLGSETQLPDPTIESFEGVGNTSAYRGLVYAVLSEFQLADYGNRVPSFRFECSTVSTETIAPPPASLDYTVPGIYTWEKPALLESVTLTVIGGGGGGGGGGIGSAQPVSGGQGGGGGGYSVATVLAAALADTVTVTVGAGGGGAAILTSFTSNGLDGSSGTGSSFGAHVTADGGGYGGRGTAGFASYWYVNGGIGSTYRGGTGGGSGDWLADGSPGDNGTSGLGVGGGGAGGNTNFNASDAHQPGAGAASPDGGAGGAAGTSVRSADPHPTDGSSPSLSTNIYRGAGGGGGGSGVKMPQAPTSVGAHGAAGSRYGGGGGGGGATTTFGAPQSSAGAGGAGAGGLVRVEYVYTASPETPPTCITLGDIVRDICRRTGLASDQVDVSDLTQCVDGYAITRVMPGRDAISPLRSYGFFDCVESGPKLKWPARGKDLVAVLTEDDLAAHIAGETRPSAVQISRAQEVELPRRVRVHYAQTDMNYEPGEQSASRLAAGAEEVGDIELAVAMGDMQAAQIADVLLYDLWVSRNTYEFALGTDWLDLEPADAISIPIEGRQERIRILTIDLVLPGLLQVAATRDDDGQYISYAIGAGSAYGPGDGASITTLGVSDLVLLDIPMLQDSHNDIGYYAAVRALGGNAGFSGALLFKSLDGGATYVDVVAMEQEATIGTVVTPLPSGPTTIVDGGNELIVDIDSDSLESITETGLYSGANLAAIGGPGRWELIQFQTAEALGSPEQWRLTNLLRGRKGTEWAVGMSVAGDRFVLLDGALERLDLNLSALGSTIYHKAVLVGATIDGTTEVSFVGNGVALRPYAPIDVEGDRGTGDLVLTWKRRGRIGRELLSGADIPLSEMSEAYEVDVLDAGVVVRTLSASAQTVTYTSVDQGSDFGSPVPDSITVRVYQLSGAVGRGYPAEATV